MIKKPLEVVPPVDPVIPTKAVPIEPKVPTMEEVKSENARLKEELEELGAHFKAKEAQIGFLEAAINALQTSMAILKKRLPAPK